MESHEDLFSCLTQFMAAVEELSGENVKAKKKLESMIEEKEEEAQFRSDFEEFAKSGGTIKIESIKYNSLQLKKKIK